MSIEYKVNAKITVEQFIDILKSSNLAERRPVDDQQCMQGMINNSNLIVTAWDEGNIVGIARSVTDFHYACYLSDLAVSQTYQRKGIGKKLQALTQGQLKSNCSLILLAAPLANKYYEKIGFTNNQRCWVLRPNDVIINNK